MTTTATGMQFFVLRVASNKEDRVREALLRKVKIEGVEDVVGRILVPTERVRSMKGGVRKESDRKLYPGYVFIELELDKDGRIPDKVWFMIKETERPEEAASLKTEFKKSDKVKVTNGAFMNFEGEVDEIIQHKGMVRIIT